MLRKSCLLGLIALALVGCGGSGGGGAIGTDGRSPTNTTRNNVQKTHDFTMRSLTQSGIQTPIKFGMPMPGGMAGGGGTVPMIGGFIRHMPPPGVGGTKPGRVKTRGDGGGGNSGGGGGTDPGGPPADTFYYDEYLGLWVQTNFTDTSYGMDFFVDEAKTQSAGHMVSNWPADWTTYPVIWHSEYNFTAGVLDGSHGTFDSSMTSETAGSMNYDSVWGGDHARGRSSWSDRSSTWTNRYEAADGAWSNDNGNFANDGSGTTTCENSLGYRTSYTWNADGSGNGRLEGPDPGMPATIRWDSMGNGTITYADGTQEEFHWWVSVMPGDAPPPDAGGGKR